MKKYLFSSLVVALFALGFSASNENLTPDGTNTPQPKASSETVSFYLDPQSAEIFAANDAIGVFAVESGAELKAAGNYADNVRYVSNGLTFESANAIVQKGQLAYYAIAPYQQTAANVFNFKAELDQSTPAKFKKSNVSTAYAAATDALRVPLNFQSRMSEVAIEFTGDEIANATLAVVLNNVLTQTTVNLSEGTSVGNGTPGNVTCLADAHNTFRAFIAPQTLAAETVFMTVNLNGTDIPLKLTDALTFDAGSKLLYSIKVVNGELIVTSGSFGYDKRLDDVVPAYIREKMGEYIPIYTGVNPPSIEGAYLMEPLIGVYLEDHVDDRWGFGMTFTSEVFRFFEQDNTNNTIKFASRSVSGSAFSEGKGAFISGYGNFFTVFLSNEGALQNVYTRQATVISGILTPEGIRDISYAFVMVEKGDDPNHIVMEEGYFRVFNDGDGLSVNTTWETGAHGLKAPAETTLPRPWSNAERFQ